jgi:murein DD-endopeptidase MepM/ murein hydrolase activator NlpD
MRNFKDSDSLVLIWDAALLNAKSNQLEASLPFAISSQSGKAKASALGYTIELQKGEILKISVERNLDSSVVFIDLFEIEADATLSEKPLVSNEWKVDTISYKTQRSGFYKVVIQPELRDSLVYNTKIYTQPSFRFPVSGKGNVAMGSFWGVTRDGGKRSHEGIDIFAARGTPVLAATAGSISFTGNRGLGGKQVWLRDGLFGQSLYYAHLDSIMIATGARVKRGDTLGLVGNTGNAKTTSPHLHFGIYTRSGAIDPLPFIKKQEIPISISPLTFTQARTKLQKNELRTGASTTYENLKSLSKDQLVEIVGKTQQWYHVRLADSLEGFMHQSLLYK